MTLHWFAPGDDGAFGQAAGYELQTTQSPANAGDFLIGVRSDLPAPLPATSPERFVVTGLASGAPYYFAIRARDQSGNVGASSNIVFVTTAGGSGAPWAPAGVAALRARPMPSRVPVEVVWQGSSPGAAATSRSASTI